MKFVFIQLALGLFSSHVCGTLTGGEHATDLPEVFMNASQIVQYYGYPYEEHWLTTEDGYVLYLLRIPHGRDAQDGQTTNTKKPVALVQHGFITSCDCFLMDVREGNLPFVLADKGVDVWLGNNRGSRYSINHTTLHTDSLEFWNFTWDDMAAIDLPAMVNYITNQTKSEQIYYAGVSQGTAIGFARFSEDKQLESKIKHFVALAPIGRVGHATSSLTRLVPYAREVETFFDTFGRGKFFIPRALLQLFAQDVCKTWGVEICANALFSMVGADPSNLNKTRLPVIMGHNPDSTSVNTVLQWVQAVKTDRFQKFDYGPDGNRKRYGQANPPLYDPSKVKVPVAVFRGGKDALADPTDVAWLLPQLNVTNDIYVPYYNHMDSITSENAKDLVFPTIIKIITGN